MVRSTQAPMIEEEELTNRRSRPAPAPQTRTNSVPIRAGGWARRSVETTTYLQTQLMSIRGRQLKIEMNQYLITKSYYDAIRSLWIERITFTFAMLAAIAMVLSKFRISLIASQHYNQSITIFYWTSCILFFALDSIISKARHPIPAMFGPFNPARILEKFTMQGRAWQLVLVIVVPQAAHLIAVFMIVASMPATKDTEPGAGQSYTQPANKIPVEVQPPPPTSKDGAR